ncbi:3-hydroxyacyl-CoA dehydrogenase family protein [Chloroflexota bacterium]
MKIKKVGVAGCGIMGSGIAQICAQLGYEVVVSETSDELLNKGLASIDSFLARGIERGKVSQKDKDSTTARIKGTTNNKDFGDCDLVIEAIIEDLAIKQQFFAELDKVCPEHTILATNTSCISVIDIGAKTNRLDKVLGMHFFNPAQIMRLIEIVRTVATSDETLEAVKGFCQTLGKTIAVAKDTPGFLTSRLGVVQGLEAIRMFETGVGTAEDIDTAMKLGYNLPMGPLELTDLIGLDTRLHVASSLYEATKDPKFAPPVLLQKMVVAGWLGRKTGKGFYEYK